MLKSNNGDAFYIIASVLFCEAPLVLRSIRIFFLFLQKPLTRVTAGLVPCSLPLSFSFTSAFPFKATVFHILTPTTIHLVRLARCADPKY